MLDLKQQRVLVTGGSGFLGRHVCAKLADMGVEMWAPSRRDGDLTDQDKAWQLMSQFRPDVVIHLAAECGGIGKNAASPADMFRRNMTMGLEVIDACRFMECKLVLIGTVCSYPKFCPVPFKESDLWNGYPEETNAPYGIAKRALFEMARAYHQQYGLKCACLLPANLYGPGDNFDLETSHVIPAMIRKFVEAKESGADSVELWGDGMPTREFLYVTDAADAIIRAAELVDDPSPINIGTGMPEEIRFIADCISGKLDGRARIIWNTAKPNGQMRRQLDTTLAKRLLNWKATIGLNDGLRKTIDWYLER